MEHVVISVSGGSSGKTQMTGGDVNVWELESSRGFFTHVSDAQAMMT